MRMAYLRKPDDQKRGNPKKEKRNPAPPQKVIMPSASSDVPILPVGEDDASQQRHLKLLQTEMKKVNPNKQITRELMKRTFPTRRKEILQDGGSVEAILKMYPALKYPDEVGFV